jgi:hypothetical protein
MLVVEGSFYSDYPNFQGGTLMAIDILSTFVALILAISLAAERLVSILKTFFKWLDEKKANAGAEKVRRIVVLVIAFLAAWITAAFLTEGGGWSLFGSIVVSDGHTLPAWLVGFLASGGSALWNNILGYTKAVKDIRKEQLPEAIRGPN